MAVILMQFVVQEQAINSPVNARWVSGEMDGHVMVGILFLIENKVFTFRIYVLLFDILFAINLL